MAGRVTTPTPDLMGLLTETSPTSNVYKYGSTAFDVSRVADIYLQAQIVQTIVELIYLSRTSAAASLDVNGWAGQYIEFTDSEATYLSIVPSSTAQQAKKILAVGGVNGLTAFTPPSTNVVTENYIYINSVPPAIYNLTNFPLLFSTIVGFTVHELTHAAGFNHTSNSATAPDFSGDVYQYDPSNPENTIWNQQIGALKNAFSVLSPIYDPAEGRPVALNTTSWASNEQIFGLATLPASSEASSNDTLLSAGTNQDVLEFATGQAVVEFNTAGIVSVGLVLEPNNGATNGAVALLGIHQVLEGLAVGYQTISGLDVASPSLIVGLGDGNTLISVSNSDVEYGAGNNNVFYGNPNPPVINTALGTVNPPYDLLIAGALDPSSSPTITGSDTFYAETGNNLMIGTQGSNAFVFNYAPITASSDLNSNPYNPSFNIVWGGGGASTYYVTGAGSNTATLAAAGSELAPYPASFFINVVVLYMHNPTVANVSNLDFDNLYQEAPSAFPNAETFDYGYDLYYAVPDPTLVIVNPGSNDRLVFDGQTLTTGSYAGTAFSENPIYADGEFDQDEGINSEWYGTAINESAGEGVVTVYPAGGNYFTPYGVPGDLLQISGVTNGVFGLNYSNLGSVDTFLDPGDSPGTLAPGNGISDLEGSDGEVYAIGADQGSITVDNAVSSSSTAYGTISLSGVVIADEDFQVGGLDNNDLVITVPSTDGGVGTTIDVPNELQSDPSEDVFPPIAQVQDGSTTLTYEQIVGLLDTGAPGRTSIYGDADANVLNSGGYATYAQGNGGGDDFIYDVGYGSLDINEVDTDGVFGNTLTLGPGISEGSVSLTADSLGNIYLTDGHPGDQIKLDGMLSGLSDGVQDIEFSGGTVWSQFTAPETLLPLTVTADDGIFVVQYGYLLTLNGSSDEFGIVGGDTITVIGASDTIDGGGTASVVVTGVAYVTDAGDGGMIATSAAGGDLLVENGGNDTLAAGGNNDTLVAGAGNDEITVNGYDVVELAAGADTVTVLSGAGYVTAGPEGGTGSLLFFGGTAPSTVTGSAGSETIYAGSGGGIFYGGTGGSNILVGSTDAAPGEALDLIAVGTSNYLQGNNTGDDLLQLGAATNATIVSEFEGDTVNGGAGSSLVLLSAPYGQDTVNLGSGAATVSVTGAGDALVYANAGPLEFIGGTAASTVVGGSGGETVYAGPGGGAFTGGTEGANVLVGATDAAPGQFLTLTAAGSTNYLQGNNDGLDLLQAGSASNATIVSEAGNDTITGGSGSAFILLAGGSGADSVNLGSGAATVSVTGAAQALVNGGAGSLEFIGGSGAATVLGGTGNETIYPGSGGGYYAAGTGANNVLVGGGGRATLLGSAGAYVQGDTTGAGAADSLVAGSGNETLVAGAGADTLAGSEGGTDTFSFLNEHAGQTYIITGFHTGDDLYFASTTIAGYAAAHQVTSGSTTTITLADSTRIVMQGVSATLPSGSFV